MHYLKSTIVIFLVLLTSNSYAQSFESKKEILDYYKENPKEFGSPKEGWHEVWIIMPYESDFVNEFDKKEVVEASVFLEGGLVREVFYDGYAYAQKVNPMNKVKKGKATFQKLFVNMNSNLTEVYSAYSHTVLFKDTEEDKYELDEVETETLSFYTTFTKADKQGFYVFVKNPSTNEFDFIGYLKESCENASDCDASSMLQKKILKGNYQILSVQNKILFNRQMPQQMLKVNETNFKKSIELLANSQLSE